jgi:hypothetical protein
MPWLTHGRVQAGASTHFLASLQCVKQKICGTGYSYW